MTKVPKGLKVGDLIEVIGTDWTTYSDWLSESSVFDEVGVPTICQVGYFMGIKDGNILWCATRIVWHKNDNKEPQVKYTHLMPLKCVEKVRKLR